MLRDRTPVPEEDLQKSHEQLRYFNRTGTTTPEQRAKVSKGGLFLSMAFGVICMVVFVGLSCLIIWSANYLSAPTGYTRISLDVFALRYIIAFFFGMSMYILPFIIPKTAKIIEGFDKTRGKKDTDIKKSVYGTRIALLFAFIIVFPFFSLGLNYNAAYNENEIVYNPFFSYNQTVTKYEEVSNVNRYFHRNNNGKISSVHYIITLKNGYTIDTLFTEPTAQTYEIHKHLKEKNPALFENLTVDEPREDIIQFLKSEYKESAWESIFFIFDLDYYGS